MHTAPDCGVCPRQGRLRPGCLISLCYHCLTCGSSRLLVTDGVGGGGGEWEGVTTGGRGGDGGEGVETGRRM